MPKPTLTIFYQFNPWDSSIGGIQTVIRSFIKHAPEEFEVRMVGLGTPGKHIAGQWQALEFGGTPLQFFSLFNLQGDNVRKLVPTTIRYTMALLRQQFTSDFMHFHRLEPTLAARKWKSDKYLFIHNDIHQQIAAKDRQNATLWRRFPQAYFAMERALVQQFNHIFSCNSESADLYRQHYPTLADRVSLIRNTVDTDICQPLSDDDRQAKRQAYAKAHQRSVDTKYVLFAGRLHPQKDPLLLIESFAALNRPDTHLLIAGDGELAPQVADLIERRQLQSRVTLLGPLNQEQLVAFYHLAHTLILTSAFEGLPLVVLEALACGTPVVTTHCGETPKFLSPDSGIVCPTRTPEAIADALQHMLSQPERYPVAACLRVAQPYSARHVIHGIYETMLTRWKPHP
jgi:glycosyltransferase involved in cell wall biosynthesis